MLPSVSPLTNSPKKRLQSTGEDNDRTNACDPPEGGPHDVQLKSARLRDADEDSLLRLVDAERLLDHVAVPVELDGQAEQRALDGDVRPLDLPANLRAGGLAVLARAVDRPGDDLRRHVARGAEELRVAAVALLEGRDAPIRRVDGEERVVDVVPQAREQRIEETVGAHQLHTAPAEGLHLLAEGLPLRGQLPRQVDELGVPRDLVDDRREVRLRLADAVTRNADALGLELCLNLVGEADAVGLLVVDDVDALHLQRLEHVVGDALAL